MPIAPNQEILPPEPTARECFDVVERVREATGLTLDLTARGMGVRSDRYSMLVDNGDFLQGNPMGDYIAYERGMKEGDHHPVVKAMNVLGYDPHITVDAAWSLPSQVKRVHSIADVLRASNFVSLHIPLMPETRGIVNAAAAGRNGSLAVPSSRSGKSAPPRLRALRAFRWRLSLPRS